MDKDVDKYEYGAVGVNKTLVTTRSWCERKTLFNLDIREIACKLVNLKKVTRTDGGSVRVDTAVTSFQRPSLRVKAWVGQWLTIKLLVIATSLYNTPLLNNVKRNKKIPSHPWTDSGLELWLVYYC